MRPFYPQELAKLIFTNFAKHLTSSISISTWFKSIVLGAQFMSKDTIHEYKETSFLFFLNIFFRK
jgi:hypothetical protein